MHTYQLNLAIKYLIMIYIPLNLMCLNSSGLEFEPWTIHTCWSIFHQQIYGWTLKNDVYSHYCNTLFTKKSLKQLFCHANHAANACGAIMLLIFWSFPNDPQHVIMEGVSPYHAPQLCQVSPQGFILPNNLPLTPALFIAQVLPFYDAHLKY